MQTKRNRPKKYPVTRSDGRVVHVTVPENDPVEPFDAIREHLSPQAVAAIVAWLRPAHTNNPNVNREVSWFADQLAEMLGPELNPLTEELGL